METHITQEQPNNIQVTNTKTKSTNKKLAVALIFLIVLALIAFIFALNLYIKNQEEKSEGEKLIENEEPQFTKAHAIEFNNKIAGEQTRIVQGFIDFSSKIASGNLSRSEAFSNLEQTKTIIGDYESVLLEASEMLPPEDAEGQEFIITARDLFEFYSTILQSEYIELLNIAYSQVVTPTDAEKADQLITNIQRKERELDTKFAEAQKDFALKYNFQLDSNTIQQEFE